MKVIEVTCPNSGKHDVGVLLNKKEQEIFYESVKEYSENHKRKTAAKKFFKYIDKHFPA